jgi:DNA-binding MarR family transcriptional regulator
MYMDRLEEIRGCLCLNLRMAARAVSAAYDEALRPLGLRVTQFSLLGGVAALGPVNYGKLAQALALDESTLPRSLGLLAKKGLIKIEPGADKRERLASLTPKGSAALDAAYAPWKSVQTRFEKELPRALMQLRRIRVAVRRKP